MSKALGIFQTTQYFRHFIYKIFLRIICALFFFFSYRWIKICTVLYMWRSKLERGIVERNDTKNRKKAVAWQKRVQSQTNDARWLISPEKFAMQRRLSIYSRRYRSITRLLIGYRFLSQERHCYSYIGVSTKFPWNIYETRCEYLRTATFMRASKFFTHSFHPLNFSIWNNVAFWQCLRVRYVYYMSVISKLLHKYSDAWKLLQVSI